ncbi:helix-turn-helix transcriptional regulator [Thiohalocapsa marina]|uniref:helix-turn-helix transcriptional regulator n=1 Tax=Thiohalocapsa marina TaxID=424902 RepID=UPI0036DDC8F6
MATATAPYWATYTPQEIPPAELYQQLDTGAAAAFLNVPKRNLELMRQHGDGPLFVRVGKRAVRYRLLDLIRYQERQLRQSSIQTEAPASAA